MDGAANGPYYADLDRRHLMPGWARRERMMWPEPRPKFKTCVWRFAEARAALEQAGDLVTTEQAERRNLIMVNPLEGNNYATSRNIIAAYQMILPGERAHTHRHSSAALRLAVDLGPETYTVVDGVRIDMADGDVVLTPGWCWHGHANDGPRPSYWIDFLDVPFVAHIEATFVERHARKFATIERVDPHSPFRIPAEAALGAAPGQTMVEIAKGAIPTIGLYLIRAAAAPRRRIAKSTANNLYAVIKGRPRFIVEQEVDTVLEPGDLITVPGWHAHEIEATGDTAVLRVSDEPLMAMTGHLRTAEG